MGWMIGFFGIALLVFLARIGGGNDVSLGSSPGVAQEEKIARAIAKAEGFFTDSQLLQRLNNPVGLKPVGGGALIQFATVQDGWNAAYRQIRLILTNDSSVYNRDMSISQIAPIWTGNDNPQAWATIVSRELGVDRNTPIFQV